MVRIAPAAPPYDGPTERLLAEMMPPGVPPIRLFRTFARHPDMARAIRPLGGYTFSKNLSLSARQRELAILRTCAQCRCEYEWGVHMAFFSERVGITEAQARSLVHGTPADSCWTDESERLLLNIVDELPVNATIDDSTWQASQAHFTDEQMLDISLLAGWYRTISYLANVAMVEREDGAPRFDDYASSGPPEP